jgi:ubiquinol-cytochrome c reductase iron-sulfur subunit
MSEKFDEILDSNTEKAEAPANHTRRDFMVMSASALAAVGAVAGAIPFVKSLGPSEDVLAVGTTEVDLSKIKEGETATVMWRGTPVFIKHRTAEDIAKAKSVAMEELKDPEDDSARVKKGREQWLVMIGVCTHLGCVPLGNKGEYNGWFCPCHGSQYDTSGRIRKGPAPTNLPIPPYEFISETVIKIG